MSALDRRLFIGASIAATLPVEPALASPAASAEPWLPVPSEAEVFAVYRGHVADDDAQHQWIRLGGMLSTPEAPGKIIGIGSSAPPAGLHAHGDCFLVKHTEAINPNTFELEPRISYELHRFRNLDIRWHSFDLVYATTTDDDVPDEMLDWCKERFGPLPEPRFNAGYFEPQARWRGDWGFDFRDRADASEFALRWGAVQVNRSSTAATS